MFGGWLDSSGCRLNSSVFVTREFSYRSWYIKFDYAICWLVSDERLLISGGLFDWHFDK